MGQGLFLFVLFVCLVGFDWKNRSCKRKVENTFIVKYLHSSVAYILKGSDIALVWGAESILCNVFVTLELLRAGRLIPAHKLEAHLQTDCQTFIY